MQIGLFYRGILLHSIRQRLILGSQIRYSGVSRRLDPPPSDRRIELRFQALDILSKHLKLYSTGDQRGDVEVHVREGKPAPLPNPELLPRIVYLLKLAEEREKEAEAMQRLK